MIAAAVIAVATRLDKPLECACSAGQSSIQIKCQVNIIGVVPLVACLPSAGVAWWCQPYTRPFELWVANDSCKLHSKPKHDAWEAAHTSAKPSCVHSPPNAGGRSFGSLWCALTCTSPHTAFVSDPFTPISECLVHSRPTQVRWQRRTKEVIRAIANLPPSCEAKLLAPASGTESSGGSTCRMSSSSLTSSTTNTTDSASGDDATSLHRCTLRGSQSAPPGLEAFFTPGDVRTGLTAGAGMSKTQVTDLNRPDNDLTTQSSISILLS